MSLAPPRVSTIPNMLLVQAQSTRQQGLQAQLADLNTLAIDAQMEGNAPRVADLLKQISKSIQKIYDNMPDNANDGLSLIPAYDIIYKAIEDHQDANAVKQTALRNKIKALEQELAKLNASTGDPGTRSSARLAGLLAAIPTLASGTYGTLKNMVAATASWFSSDTDLTDAQWNSLLTATKETTTDTAKAVNEAASVSGGGGECVLKV